MSVKIIDNWDTFAKGNEDAMDRALERMSIDIERQAKMTVPVVKGPLKSSGRHQKTGHLSWIVFFDKEYASAVELGAKPHTISPGAKGFLAFQIDGKWIFTRKPIHHPGSKGRFFLTKAIEQITSKDTEYIKREAGNIHV